MNWHKNEATCLPFVACPIPLDRSISGVDEDIQIMYNPSYELGAEQTTIEDVHREVKNLQGQVQGQKEYFKDIENQLKNLVATSQHIAPVSQPIQKKSLLDIIKDKSLFGLPVFHITVRDIVYWLGAAIFLYGKSQGWW